MFSLSSSGKKPDSTNFQYQNQAFCFINQAKSLINQAKSLNDHLICLNDHPKSLIDEAKSVVDKDICFIDEAIRVIDEAFWVVLGLSRELFNSKKCLYLEKMSAIHLKHIIYKVLIISGYYYQFADIY